LLCLAGLVGALLFSGSCSLLGREKKDNVVLIIIDTIRADRLGCYGHSLPTSPNIDAFASEGTLFEQAVTCAPTTLPSVSAILTSTYPITSNVRYNGKFFLSDASVTLAEILKEKGYKTAAFVGGFPLDSRFKTDQGFEVYDDDFSGSADKWSREWIDHQVGDFERTAAEVNEGVFEWLGGVGDKPFFLVVHYFDPHWPYRPPAPYDGRFESPYNGEVAYTDEHVGALLDKIDESGLGKNTLIILTGDHGESLGSHGEPTHGDFLFDTTMLVPLVLHHKGRIPKGRRIKSMVKTIDIMPTILDFLGVADGPHSQGVSLLPAIDGKPSESPIFLETMLPYYERDDDDVPTRVFGLRTAEWKLVYVLAEKDGKTYWSGELYNVRKDPFELFDVREENIEVFRSMFKQMLAAREAHLAQSVASDNYIEMDDEVRAKLKALGYLN